MPETTFANEHIARIREETTHQCDGSCDSDCSEREGLQKMFDAADAVHQMIIYGSLETHTAPWENIERFTRDCLIEVIKEASVCLEKLSVIDRAQIRR